MPRLRKVQIPLQSQQTSLLPSQPSPNNLSSRVSSRPAQGFLCHVEVVEEAGEAVTTSRLAKELPADSRKAAQLQDGVDVAVQEEAGAA